MAPESPTRHLNPPAGCATTAPPTRHSLMRIAYITSVYARASDTFIRNEVIELRRRGHEVFTFSIRRDAADAHVSDEVRSEQASTDYVLEHSKLSLVANFLSLALGRPARVFSTMSLARSSRVKGVKSALLHWVYLIEAAYVARRLQALGIEVLHNHIAENSATVAMYASLLSGVPYSMTVHGPGIFFHPREWALHEKVQRSSFTACITEFCKSQCMLFSERWAWPKLHIVRCGVGQAFEQAKTLPMPATPRLVFVGRLCAEKGVPLLIEAVARHVAAGGACELALVGDGPMRGEIERIIAERGLGGSIRILGWQSSEGVRAEIERSRVLVLPSFAEGLPVVIMEALALGRPVISTRIAGIPELVADGENGWIVSPGSVDELQAAIAAATAADPERLAEMGRAGVVAVRAWHHLGTEVDKLEGLFRKVVMAVPA
ncbi:MAG: colanic acid biosynthesis glycosyltransferase WcaL [Oxalobacteraceae bacterium]|nr:MAG: colanic acid biosynthesis glycosyltransferase WcaL [Oxalobacteraceae bacterium]